MKHIFWTFILVGSMYLAVAGYVWASYILIGLAIIQVISIGFVITTFMFVPVEFEKAFTEKTLESRDVQSLFSLLILQIAYLGVSYYLVETGQGFLAGLLVSIMFLSLTFSLKSYIIRKNQGV